MRRELLVAFFLSFVLWIKSFRLPKDLRAFFKSKKPAQFTLSNKRYALKTSIAVVLSYLLALPISHEFAVWAPISAIIVMQVNVASSIETSVDRIIGTLYGAVLGILIHYLLPPNTLGFTLGLWIIAAICALLLVRNPLYRLAGITSVSIFLLASAQESAFHFGVTFMLLIILSIVVSVFVSVLLWPVSGAEELSQSVRKQYFMAADYLDAITFSFFANQQHLIHSYIDELHDAISQNRTKFRKIKEYEGMNLSRHYPEMEQLIGGLELIRIYLTSMLDALDSIADPIASLPMAEELKSLSSSSASGLRWLAAHTDDQAMPEVRFYIEASSIGIADLLTDKSFKKLSHAQLIQVLAFYNAMNHLAESVAILEEQIYIINHKQGAKKRKRRKFRKNLLTYIKRIKRKFYRKYFKNSKCRKHGTK